jgi:hypothetical protein
MFRYVKANLVGIVYGTALNVGDVQKQAGLLERAYKLGQKLASE